MATGEMWPGAEETEETPLAVLRRRVPLTQRELAVAAGVSVGTVRGIEQGVHKAVRPRAVRALAAALGIAPAAVAEFRATGGSAPPQGGAPPTPPSAETASLDALLAALGQLQARVRVRARALRTLGMSARARQLTDADRTLVEALSKQTAHLWAEVAALERRIAALRAGAPRPDPRPEPHPERRQP